MRIVAHEIAKNEIIHHVRQTSVDVIDIFVMLQELSHLVVNLPNIKVAFLGGLEHRELIHVVLLKLLERDNLLVHNLTIKTSPSGKI